MTDVAPITSPLTAAEIFSRTGSLLRANAALVAIALVLLVAVGLPTDLGYVGPELLIVANVATLVMQYWLTQSLLDRLELRTASRPRFPAFFLLSIVTTIGVILGLVLLIIPGIVLLVRWSIAVPAVIATEDGLVEAIASSWRETEARFWPIFQVFLVISVLAILGVVVGLLVEMQISREVGAVMFELSFNTGLIVGWHAAVVIYAETRSETRYKEVFA